MTGNPFGSEQALHGAAWARVHGGYFADPEVARPLVEAIHDAIGDAQPDAVVDLGGGTGYLLDRVRVAGIEPGIRLTVLESSAPQLAEAKKLGLDGVQRSVAAFRRADVARPGQRTLWTMRSVLHYAGKTGLAPLLGHLRAQAEPGDIWVHQTACFESERDAACLNALYRLLRTGKWYPTVADLQAALSGAGWQVETVWPAPTLHLDSGELGLRYGLAADELRAVRAEMKREFGLESPVLHVDEDGFRADLHYRIFRCRAQA